MIYILGGCEDLYFYRRLNTNPASVQSLVLAFDLMAVTG